MRAVFLLLLAPLAVSAAETRLTDPVARYSAMLEQSPFALATVVEAPPEPTDSFAANWELVSIARFRNEKGEEKDYVGIRSRDRRTSFTLAGDEPSTEEGEAKGVSIHSIDRQDITRKSTVTLKRGAELAKVEFSQEASAPPANAAPINTAGMNPNQARAIQMQQQQLQQQRLQQMQGLAAPGAVNSNKPPAVFNPAAGGVVQPPSAHIAPNGLNLAVPASGVIYPQPTGANVTPGVPNNADPRRRLRVINTRQ